MSADGGVLAVCVNWNGRGVLGDTLAALAANDYGRLRIWVVDNASLDGSLEEVPPQIRTLRLAHNGGYGAAINAAVQEASKEGSNRPRYYLLINNDVVVKPDLVARLVKFAEGEGPGIFGPAVFRQGDPSRLDAAWGRLSWSHVLARYYGKGAEDGVRWRRTHRVELLLGCLLLVHSDVFDAIGLFDQGFFMYHEEVDFLYRAKRGGFPSYYCPFVQALHRGAHSTRDLPLQKLFWVRRNALYFIRKHRPGLGRWLYFWITALLSLLFQMVVFRWRRGAVVLRALRAGMRMEAPPSGSRGER